MRIKSFKLFESLDNFQQEVETCIDSFMDDYDFTLVYTPDGEAVFKYHDSNPIMHYISFSNLEHDCYVDFNDKMVKDLIVLNRKLKDKNLSMYITVHQTNNAVYYEFGEDMTHEQSTKALLQCDIQGEQSNDAYRFDDVKDLLFRYLNQKILLEIYITTI